MARPRTFEIDEALDAAIDAFWDRGYEATSMSDLMQAMGLQKGSIYKVWEDKHTLFLAALRRYLDIAITRMTGVVEASKGPLEALQALQGLFTTACAESNRGCFAFNTVVELAPHDREAADILAKHHDNVIHLFAKQIAAGQDEGLFRTDRSAKDLAQFLFVVMTGMVTRSKGSLPKVQARRIAELSLETLR